MTWKRTKIYYQFENLGWIKQLLSFIKIIIQMEAYFNPRLYFVIHLKQNVSKILINKINNVNK